MSQQVIIVTGGAGFIGSAVIRYLIHETSAIVINLDKLTYAANLANVTEVAGNARYRFERADVCHKTDLERIFREHCPTAVMHLAAESHVDRSIDNPLEFIHTNVVGTATLLEVARSFWSALPPTQRDSFRFHHVSTDEVYGSLGAEGRFTETTPYLPNSPYSASKAGSDHLVRAWHHTYGLPVVVSNCSNNYGPYQFPEKLIPLMILNGLSGKPLPVYGRGDNIRDWLFVEDHAHALWTVLTRGQIGECYNIGGNCEARNIEVVESICDLLDEILGPLSLGHPRRNLITFVKDRPGHDARYAIDSTKIAEELSWRPRATFHTGLRRTVEWYIANQKWWRSLRPLAAERRGLSTPATRASLGDDREICDVRNHLAT